MTEQIDHKVEIKEAQLPIHRLDAYRVAKEFLQAVVACEIRDSRLRDQAVRAAQSCCLNIAEAAGRWGKADRARVIHIARGGCCEAGAAVEIAAISGSCAAAPAERAGKLSARVYVILGGLIRR